MKSDLYDFHTHILPGIDDGARDPETAFQMIAMEYAEGVRTIVATPHYIPDGKNADKQKVLDAYQLIREHVQENYPDMTFLLGNELYYRDVLLRDLQEERAFTMAETDYVLVEFRTSSEYDKIRNALRRLQENGYRPILAHVERYAALLDTDRLREIRELGVVIQMNTASFTGGVFNRESRFCLHAAKLGLLDLLGSDCHDMKYRAPMMQKAVAKLEKALGGDMLRRILYQNPALIMKNKML